MAGKSNIEWTTMTWNPLVGCSIVSPGCTNCYAMRMAARIEAMNAEHRASGRGSNAPQYDGTTKRVNGNWVWTGKVNLAPEKTLLEPLRRRKPTTYFVNSMSDLFHENVPDEWIDRIFAVMALTPQHTYQVLTKRAERMRDYILAKRKNAPEWISVPGTGGKVLLPYEGGWPKNVWLGVSTERQQEADERIPLLLQTPAAVRFISAEPLLGPIDLTNLGDTTFSLNAFTGDAKHLLGMRDRTAGKLDWVIVGGESGPSHRSMNEEWADGLRYDCGVAGVAFFMKQMAGKKPIPWRLQVREMPVAV